MGCTQKENILDIIIDQGATYELKLELTTAEGTIIDLTDASVRMQIRKDFGGKLIASSDTDITIDITPLLGVIEITIADDVTEAFVDISGKYDVEIEYASGKVERIIEGEVTICREVTI